MAQWVKALDSKPDNLSVTITNRIIRGEKRHPTRGPLTSSYVYAYVRERRKKGKGERLASFSDGLSPR